MQKTKRRSVFRRYLIGGSCWFVGGGMLATSCGMELREAAFAGLTQYVTQTTVELLTQVSPLSDDDSGTATPDSNMGGDDDTSDPFDEPIQS